MLVLKLFVRWTVPAHLSIVRNCSCNEELKRERSSVAVAVLRLDILSICMKLVTFWKRSLEKVIGLSTIGLSTIDGGLLLKLQLLPISVNY